MMQKKYKTINERGKETNLAPIRDNLQSAYAFYQLPPGETNYSDSFSRTDTSPPHTNYTVKFKGTLDHIIYRQSAITLLELLEIPKEEDLKAGGAIPSVKFPSDHLRIEAKFMLPPYDRFGN